MRIISGDVAIELSKQRVSPFVACQIQFADQTMSLWSGIGTLQLFEQQFLGVGHLAGIAPIVETTDIQANGVQLSLSGVPQDLLAESLSMCRQGMPITIWIGFMDPGGDVIADPVVAFVGHMDSVSVDEGAETAMITVNAESRLVDLQRARIRRYTDDDQQRTSPGDKGFQYVPMVQDWNGAWGLHDRGR